MPALAAGSTPMKAAVHRCYGPPEVVKIEDVAKPVPGDEEVLVKVHAAGVNPLDWHFMRGVPYIMRLESGFGRPKDQRLGVDFSGTVEAVGKSVTSFKPGDEVFGGRNGAFAEYVVVNAARNIQIKPARITFEQAAGVPIAAVTALQALRDKGELEEGQKVLINGASGGVGTFAVQIAKAFGAEVTGVASTRNVELVRSLGADHVIDYTKQDFTQGDVVYDLVVDNVGNHSFDDIRRVLKPEGRYVIDRQQQQGPVARRAQHAAQGEDEGAVRVAAGRVHARRTQAHRPRVPGRADDGRQGHAGRRSHVSARRSRGGDRICRNRPGARQGHPERGAGAGLTARHPLGSNSRPSRGPAFLPGQPTVAR